MSIRKCNPYFYGCLRQQGEIRTNVENCHVEMVLEYFLNESYKLKDILEMQEKIKMVLGLYKEDKFIKFEKEIGIY